MTAVQEIREEALDRFVAAMRAALDETDTVEGFVDWKRQAQQTIWLLASEGGQDVGAAWHLRLAYRQMLVPGLEGGRAPQQEQFRRRKVLCGVAGPVVVDLVIVEAHDERRRRVRCL